MFNKPVSHSGTGPLLTLATYVLALFLTALTTLILYLFHGVINPSVIPLLYLLPVSLSTAFWGLGPGILAALTGFLAYNYFFIKPYYSLMVHQYQDLLALVVFLGVAVVLSQLIGRSQHNMAIAVAREHEAIRLSELSTLLAGLHDDQNIIRAIAEEIIETFQVDQVEIMIEAQGGQPSVFFRLPGSTEQTPQNQSTRDNLFLANQRDLPSDVLLIIKPDSIIPLQTVRGLLGEIRLWRNGNPYTPAEARLLQTFSNQGVLALERAHLLQVDTRARVLEESDRLKSSLLSSVSHELRTPLATIKAAVTSLRSEAVEWDSADRSELLMVVEEETDHLNMLVGNLLNMSRIEAGALNPDRKWNDLNELVSGVVNRMSQRRTIDHTIVVQIPEELPLIPVDYILMEQVFSNLIDNSLKYSPIHTTVVIRAHIIRQDQLLVEILNQGPNVPEEHITRIFDKFYRVTAADRVTGTGLGLSICKGIVEAHGGKIWAENLPGGFAFKITLPLTWEGVKAPMMME